MWVLLLLLLLLGKFFDCAGFLMRIVFFEMKIGRFKKNRFSI